MVCYLLAKDVWLWWVVGGSGGCEREEEMDFHARGHIAHTAGQEEEDDDGGDDDNDGDDGDDEFPGDAYR